MQRESNERRLGGITGRGFLPGRSGNPHGRVRGSVNISNLLAKQLRDCPADAEKIVTAWIGHAKRGSLRHLREMLNRLEGKPRGRVEIEAKPTRYVVSFASLSKGVGVVENLQL